MAFRDLVALQPLGEEPQGLRSHGRRLNVTDVVPDQRPRLWRSRVCVDLPQHRVDAVKACRRGQWIVVALQAQMRSRSDQSVDLCRAEMPKQPGDEVIDAVSVQAFRLDQGLEVGQAAE